MLTYKEYLTESLNFSNPKEAFDYAFDLKKRVPEVEKYLLISGNPDYICDYARFIMHSRWLKGERFILKSPVCAYYYTSEVVERRWLAAERLLKKTKDYELIISYARDVIGGRWSEIEKDLLEQNEFIMRYYKEVVKGRWLEAEPEIKARKIWGDYLLFLYYIVQENETARWSLINNGLDKFSLSILNDVKLSKEQQEQIIKIRPDLIADIKDLDPELKKKYAHELSIAKIDI